MAANMKRFGQTMFAGALAVLISGNASAQPVADPTRPPAELQSAAPGSDGPATGPLLQSIMISPSERSAIINGERVRQGGTYGNSRILKISENEVVLRSVTGTETLRLYPGVEMKPVKAAVTDSKRTESKPAPKAKVVPKVGSNRTDSRGGKPQ